MANTGINLGLTSQKEVLVCQHNVAPHVSKFSTPSMIQLMEQAASEGVSGHLQEGEVSVGIEVNIRHLAARARSNSTMVSSGVMSVTDRKSLLVVMYRSLVGLRTSLDINLIL